MGRKQYTIHQSINQSSSKGNINEVPIEVKYSKMGRKQYVQSINQSIFEQRQFNDVPIEVKYSRMGR